MSETATLDGYPSLFGVQYRVGPTEETIAPGAFASSLANPQLDVVLRVEHVGLPIARTTAGTLTLNEDRKGLHARATLDRRDPEVQSLLVKYERGDLDGQMSFAFRAVEDDWSQDYSRREIKQAEIHRGDISIVTYGASPTTSSTLRGAGGYTLERRMQTAELARGRAVSRGYVSAIDGIELRQPDEPDADDEGLVECVHCGGSGRVYSGAVCPVCLGNGLVPADDDADEDGRSERRSALAVPSAPFAARGTAWDKPSAEKRLRKWAGAEARPNAKLKRAYLWQDANGTRFGDLKFPVCDIVGGELKVIFAAVGSAAGYVTKLPQYGALKPSLERLYARAAKQFGDPSISPSWKRSAVLAGGPNDPEELRFRAEMLELGIVGPGRLLRDDSDDLRSELAFAHEVRAWRGRGR